MGFLVNFWGIRVNAVSQKRLGTVYLEETLRVLPDCLAGFLTVIYIIRKSRYFSSLLPAWPNGTKWLHNCHGNTSIRIAAPRLGCTAFQNGLFLPESKLLRPLPDMGLLLLSQYAKMLLKETQKIISGLP
jgi:hypothetical protein